MRKKICIFLSFILIFSLVGCSRENKFGVGEFSERIQNDYGLTVDESSISLEKADGKNRIYCKMNSFLLVFYLGSNDNISGFAMMLPKEDEGRLSEFYDNFQKCVSIFTLSPLEKVEDTLGSCGITLQSIKFADSNRLNTVGKFRYTVVTSEISITLFCERV